MTEPSHFIRCGASMFVFGSITGCSLDTEDHVNLGNGRSVTKSNAERYACKEGIAYDRAIQRLETATFQAAAEKIKRNPEKYGVRP